MKIDVLLPAKHRGPGRPPHFQRIKKSPIEVAEPDSIEVALGNLLFLDARLLEKSIKRELLRILPHLLHASRAWGARFAERGA